MILGKTPFDEHDPYEILGVEQDLDKREVNRVYRERMRGLTMQDPRFQHVQKAKEALTKPRKRFRADIFHLEPFPALEEMRQRFRDQKVDLGVVDAAKVALVLSEATVPVPAGMLEDLPPLEARFPISEALTADPIRARLEEIGP